MSHWITVNDPKEWGARASLDAPDYQIADCGSTESHELRLRALLRVPVQAGDSILDFGCGTGRLADLLPEGVDYLGIDWSEGVIKQARARRARENASFVVGSVYDLRPADWVVASGPFNYAVGWNRELTGRALAHMWMCAVRGIAVTVLRKLTPGRLAYSATELTGYVEALDWTHLELDCSYLPNDVCLRAWR